MRSLSIIVLAGGASRRMGTNKALLPVDENTPLIKRVVDNLRPLSEDVVLVSNTPEMYAALAVRHTSDQFLNAGPLAGLHAGLLAVQNPWALLVACDMPLIDLRLVRYMALLAEGCDVVAPRSDNEVEPLHALYHQACVPAIEKRLAAQQRRMVAFYPDVRVRYLEEAQIQIFDRTGRSFSNANTPEDWERLRALLGNDPTPRIV